MNSRFERYLLIGVSLWVIVSLACSLGGTENSSNVDSVNGTSIGVMVPPDQSLVLGSEGDPTTISIPSGAFEEEKFIQMSYLKEIPPGAGEGLTGIGTPMVVTLDGGYGRSNEPIQITMPFNSQGIKEKGEVLVGYYHENHGWIFYEPDHVDLAQGILTFTTYHFSTFSSFQADEATRMDRFAEKHATQKFVRSQSEELTEKEVEKMVEDILKEGMGVQDNKIIEMVVRGVIENIPGGEIGLALHDLNEEKLKKATLENTVKFIGEQMTDPNSSLREVTGDVGTVIAFGQAANAFAEGKDEEGIKIMADRIMENIPIAGSFYKNGKRAIAIAKHMDEVWQQREIENAFQAYSNGSEGGWLGYGAVDKGNWDDVVNNNRSSLARIQGKYILSICEAEGVDPNSLSDQQRAQLANEALENLKTQFDQRISRREQIDAIKADDLELMELLAEKGLLDRAFSTNPIYTGDEELEGLLSGLNILTDNILRDMGRSDVVDHHEWNTTDQHERDNIIQKEVLVEIIYQVGRKDLTNNPTAYERLLKEIQDRLDSNSGLSNLDIMDLTDEIIEKQLAGELEEEEEIEEDIEEDIEDEVSDEDIEEEQNDDVIEEPDDSTPEETFVADETLTEIADEEQKDDNPNFIWDSVNRCWEFIGQGKANYYWNCQNQCFDYQDQNWVYDCSTGCSSYIGPKSDQWSWDCNTNCWVNNHPDWNWDCNTNCHVYVGPESDLWAWNCSTGCWDYLDPNYTWDCATKCHIYVGPDSHLWSWDCANKCLQYVGPPVSGYTWSCGLRRWIPDED